jgi:hypothetical protein
MGFISFSLTNLVVRTDIRPGMKAIKKRSLYCPGKKIRNIRAKLGHTTAPRVSIARWKPNTFPLFSGVDSDDNKASLDEVLIPFPNLSNDLIPNIHHTDVKATISGLDIALKRYPNLINGTLRPILSDHAPKYPLLNPATASAIHSSIPINATENHIVFRYKGITGYSISLAISANKLIKPRRIIVFVKNFLVFINVII